MRKTTQKILILLYNPARESRRSMPVAFLRECLPELSDAGFRALIHYLVHQQVIELTGRGSSKRVIGTNTGDRSIEAVFSWLEEMNDATTSDKTNDCGYLIIVKPGSHTISDTTQLRQFLIKVGAISLSRGVYYWLGELPRGTRLELTSHFRTMIAVVQTTTWVLGSWQQLVREEINVNDLRDSLSGVSEQLVRLLTTKKSQSQLNHQLKVRFVSLYDQIIDVFGETKGNFVNNLGMKHQLFEVVRGVQAATNDE